MTQQKCPCKSGDLYEACCKRFHKGNFPENALQLMRARYSAYALNLPEYIIQTTHPASPQYEEDQSLWKKKLSDFSTKAEFRNLKILSFQEKGAVATVTFVAEIFQKDDDFTFTEKSYFEKFRGHWLYRSGQIASGHEPSLMTTGTMKILPLAYYGNPILRQETNPVREITKEIQQFAQEMIETMDACDGIGLAAPQVHHSIKLFVMRLPIETSSGDIEMGEALTLINPEISLQSKETSSAEEGCLSIPTIRAKVERPKSITITYQDIQGRKVQKRCFGWEARVVQHETDHLNNILFVDRLKSEEREKLEPFLKRLYGRIHDGTEL